MDAPGCWGFFLKGVAKEQGVRVLNGKSRLGVRVLKWTCLGIFKDAPAESIILFSQGVRM